MTARTTGTHWTIRLGRGLFTGPLSSDLYTDSGRCVCELVRNGMVACQRDADAWDPQRIHVELELVSRHPLTGTDALVGMDAGTGFTKGDVERFCTVGPDEDDDGSTRHGGAAQKRLGRFAYFALQRERGQDRGFTILTRTSTDGPVTVVEVTPRALSEQRLPTSTLAPDATELGRYRSYRGRFSAVVIPQPVFRTNDELVSELAPHLPRKAELCGAIRIGGKVFIPPPLASVGSGGAVVARPEDQLEAYLERVTQGTRGGIWLVDFTTGFRVGFCPSLTAHLPYPLGRTDLGGVASTPFFVHPPARISVWFRSH